MTGREFQKLVHVLLYGNERSSVGVGGKATRDVDTPFAPVPLLSLRWEE